MIPSFWIASAWQSLCSAIGASLGAQLVACPACEPVLHCPAVACHCGTSGAASAAPLASAGWSSSVVLGAFVVCLFGGLALTWQPRIRAQGEWAGSGRVGVALPSRPAWAEAPSVPSFRSASPSTTPITATSLGGEASPGGEVAVWQPRRR